MHDPFTQAFNIRWPWKVREYRSPIITIWHKDPCRGPGGDDTCGWFMRSYHGDKGTLYRIENRFKYDWDRVFNSEGGNSYFCGLFTPDGDPHFSVHGVVLNLFFMAAMEHFRSDGRTNWRAARRFMSRNLFDILMFAENPTDSLHDGVTRKFEIGCAEKYTPEKRAEKREERIKAMASCIYGWILRAERPWYRHPRWHIHHWRIQVHPWQQFRKWLRGEREDCAEAPAKT